MTNKKDWWWVRCRDVPFVLVFAGQKERPYNAPLQLFYFFFILLALFFRSLMEFISSSDINFVVFTT